MFAEVVFASLPVDVHSDGEYILLMLYTDQVALAMQFYQTHTVP